MTKDQNKTLNATLALYRMGAFGLRTLLVNKSTLAVLALRLMARLSAQASESGNDNRAPEVPRPIAVPAGNQVRVHGFGRGVQIYTWNGSNWGSAVPEATLFDDDGRFVANHFAGPTWESSNGSRVVGAVVPPTALDAICSTNPAIALWAACLPSRAGSLSQGLQASFAH